MSITTSLAIRHAMVAAIVLCGTAATLAGRQASLDAQYLTQVEAYASGAHESAVTELLSWPAAEASAVALRSLRERTRLYEVVTRTDDPEADPARQRATEYLRTVRAVAAMHLEAVVAAPLDMETVRRAHFRASETALRELSRFRDVSWKSVIGADDDDMRTLERFRHRWYVVAATHLQRIGSFVDAARVADLATREFRDQAVFHLIEGTIHESLGSPVASLDAARMRLYPALYPDRVAEAALQKARQAYERALSVDARNEEARIRLAKVHVMLGQFAAASTQLRDAATPGRLAYLASLVRGLLAEMQKRYDEAALHYREATVMSSHWQTACVALTHAVVEQGRLPEARDILRSCVERNATDDDPWLSYAMGLDWLVEPTLRALRGEFSGVQVGQDD